MHTPGGKDGETLASPIGLGELRCGLNCKDCVTVVSQGSLQVSLWKLQQLMNCKSKLQRIHYKLYLKYFRYDLYQRIIATSTFMLRRPIATI
jgi:hypothetical protein